MEATIDVFWVDSRFYFVLAYVRDGSHQGDCRIKPESNASLAKTNDTS